ncbi:helix-turn-helix domain-containing protein [Faecalicoccus pleomorphus]|uniref:Helix-turn-helix domain-containing protein n=1 Tax=Faecalicoccus pleomorphus TaxID=1323 RepID=A0AAW6CVL0_9FIRM|nr:helix-turn-helix domain-containing protein [Faecalicoccus pleomorphus]MDB7979867.1 helix-turn-helix domain-containing protein [Faecalicoccus pleomorphus]MDB7982130.1 helix-turn-helix domain-containing protein [Faecalicoccus pleomorphus]
MSKLTNDQRLEIYHKRKQGMTISDLAKLYNVNKHTIEYLIRLLDRHGEDVLRKRKNRYYSPELKLKIINRVSMEHRSINETAIEYRLLNTETLYNGMKSYKENGYTVVEK